MNSRPSEHGLAVTNVVVARPCARRQLASDGPLLLWRDAQGGSREGLLLAVNVCDRRFCTTRHVLVEGLRVGEELHSAWIDRGEIVTLHRSDAGAELRSAFLVFVGVDCGDIQARSENGPQERDAIEWLRAELDGELLDTMRERFVRVRDGVRATASEDGARCRAERTGRNEPCPCGSGKKFKRCCLGVPQS